MAVTKRTSVLSATDKQKALDNLKNASKVGADWEEKSTDELSTELVGGLEFEQGDLLLFPDPCPCKLKPFEVDGQTKTFAGFWANWRHASTGRWSPIFVPLTMLSRTTYRKSAEYYANRAKQAQRQGLKLDKVLLNPATKADIQDFIKGHTIRIFVKDTTECPSEWDDNNRPMKFEDKTVYGYIQED